MLLWHAHSVHVRTAGVHCVNDVLAISQIKSSSICLHKAASSPPGTGQTFTLCLLNRSCPVLYSTKQSQHMLMPGGVSAAVGKQGLLEGLLDSRITDWLSVYHGCYNSFQILCQLTLLIGTCLTMFIRIWVMLSGAHLHIHHDMQAAWMSMQCGAWPPFIAQTQQLYSTMQDSTA